MKVLAKGTLAIDGNIKDISLVEILDMYTVITAEKTDENNIDVNVNTNFTCDLMEALSMYAQATECDLTEYIKQLK